MKKNRNIKTNNELHDKEKGCIRLGQKARRIGRKKILKKNGFRIPKICRDVE